jgi:glycosyltransferase involved in cell wall biosynthesis
LEAAAIQKPAIATDVPGCRQVVEDQFNGFLCKLKDPIDLAHKMITMATLNQINVGYYGH